MFGVIAEVTKLDPTLKKGQIGRLAKDMIKAGYNHEQIKEWYTSPDGWYWLHDWRGQKGQYPDEKAIRDTAKKAMEGGEETEVDREWVEVQEAMRVYGRMRYPEFSSPTIKNTVDKIGWGNLCRMPDGEEGRKTYMENRTNGHKSVSAVLGEFV